MAIIENQALLNILYKFNPWWQSGIVPKEFLKEFKRKQYYTCTKAFQSELRRIVVMSGARRTGKTTIMYQMIDDLISAGVNPYNIIFFTFDHPVVRAANMEMVVDLYRNNVCGDSEFYVFIDEVQFDKNWTNYLKMLYDLNPTMRSVATGSASAAVEKGIRESGAGRWTVIKVPTLSFYEFCEIKGIKKNIPDVDVFSMHKMTSQEQTRIIIGLSDLQVHLMRYLQLGGFPELVNANDLTYAQRLLREDVLERAIKNDLPNVYEIRSVDELEKVFVYLCYNATNIINLETMSKEFENVSRPTIEKYIGYLESANIINISKSLNIQGKKALKQRNKIYIADNGIRSAVVLGANVQTDDAEMGYAMESTCFKHVLDYFGALNSLYEVGYIRSGKGEEIDIAVQYRGQPIQYIEAKYRGQSTIKDTNGIVVFGFHDTPGYVITKEVSDFGLSERKGTSLYRIPAVAFLYLIGKMG